MIPRFDSGQFPSCSASVLHASDRIGGCWKQRSSVGAVAGLDIGGDGGGGGGGGGCNTHREEFPFQAHDPHMT
eukprot:gene12608-biopygen8517